MDKPLTPRQETFCLEYVKLGNASKAAEVAGYAPNNTDKILKTTRILNRIKTLQDKIASRTLSSTIADIKERKEILTSIMRTPVERMVDITASNVIQAADIVNKMDRIYAQDAPRETETFNTFVFVLPDGTKVKPRELIEGSQKEENATEQRGSQGIHES